MGEWVPLDRWWMVWEAAFGGRTTLALVRLDYVVGVQGILE